MHLENTSYFLDGFWLLMHTVVGAHDEFRLDVVEMGTAVGHDSVRAFRVSEWLAILVADDGVQMHAFAEGQASSDFHVGRTRREVIHTGGHAVGKHLAELWIS